MTSEQIDKYASKLCEEIKLHYLKDFMLCVEGDNLVFKSESLLRNFVLLRTGWKRDKESEELFIILQKPN